MLAVQFIPIQCTFNNKPNVLFIMADDLRPELSIYGRNHVISPNFERIAKRGIVFDRVYSQIAVCFPSRHSLLTGLRPEATSIVTWTGIVSTPLLLFSD